MKSRGSSHFSKDDDVSPDEMRTIIAEYPNTSSALLPVLHITQREHGWLPDKVIEDVAYKLDLSTAHVRGVATFHTMLNIQPVARNVIQLCTNIACMLFGAETLLELLKKRYGLKPDGISEDGRFSLMVMECIGLCDQPPAMLVNRDVHTGLTAERIIEILESYD